MIIKIIISAVLMSIGLFSLSQARLVRFAAPGILSIMGFGLYCTWRPDTATAIAQLLGVGRGADLILYTWVLFTAVLSLVFEVRMRAESGRLTRLVRVLALKDPLVPEDLDDTNALAASKQKSGKISK